MHSFLFLLAILALSQAANLIRLAQAPIEVIGFWRLLGAALIMLTLTLVKQKQLWPKNVSLKTILYTLFAGLFFFVHLWTYFFSAQNTTIANSMILFSMNPLFTALITALVFKEKFSRRLLIAYAFAVIGLYQLLVHGLDFAGPVQLGDWAGLLAGVLYSAYVICSQQARKEVSNLNFTWVIYSITAMAFFLTGLSKGIAWGPYPSITWWAIGGTILIPTLMGHALFTYLLQYLNINWMSCGKLLEPVLSALVAFLLFQEQPGSNTWIAFAFTAAAVVTLFAPLGRLQPFLDKSLFKKLEKF